MCKWVKRGLSEPITVIDHLLLFRERLFQLADRILEGSKLGLFHECGSSLLMNGSLVLLLALLLLLALVQIFVRRLVQHTARQPPVVLFNYVDRDPITLVDIITRIIHLLLRNSRDMKKSVLLGSNVDEASVRSNIRDTTIDFHANLDIIKRSALLPGASEADAHFTLGVVDAGYSRVLYVVADSQDLRNVLHFVVLNLGLVEERVSGLLGLAVILGTDLITSFDEGTKLCDAANDAIDLGTELERRQGLELRPRIALLLLVVGTGGGRILLRLVGGLVGGSSSFGRSIDFALWPSFLVGLVGIVALVLARLGRRSREFPHLDLNSRYRLGMKRNAARRLDRGKLGLGCCHRKR